MYKVLIVDDEEIIVTGISRLLPWGSYGCEVAASAANGREALEMLPGLRPDIMFTDIKMPKMDGLSLIAALRSEYPDMQITILSGYPEFEYVQKAMRLGVCSYVLKPSKMDELEEALATMVERLNAERGRADAGEETEEEEGGEGTPGNFIVKSAVGYMDAHYAEKLTLPDVAAQVYVSQWHLSKLIAKVTGQSFSDLLNGIRVREAKRMLEDPALKIWEVSEAVGFSDVTHFSRIFKKMEGKSANEYRNSIG